MRQFNILQVEDDDNDIYLLKHAFEKAGIRDPLLPVRDGQEAQDYISGTGHYANRVRFPMPCLVIVDLKMPRQNGLEFIRWLRGNTQFRRLPVIMLSSSAQPQDVDEAYDAGANAFVVKPASTADRIRLATAIKAFWLEFNLPPSKCARSSIIQLRNGPV